MPAFTPNRNYPYSVPADPADVPQALQDLAEAIDTDLFNLNATIPTRPALRVRGTGPYVANTAAIFSQANDLPLDLVDFNTGLDFIFQTDGKGILVLTPGVYFVLGTVAVPRPTAGAVRTIIQLELRRWTGVTPALFTRNGYHLVPSPSDQVRTIGTASVISLSGSETLRMSFSSSPITGPPDQYTVSDRTLTVIRMSPTP